MHILFKEINIDSVLCIGEVKSPNNIFFDHSWVEIDNKIYDATIHKPLKTGKPHPQVFQSIDIKSNKPTMLEYGAEYGEGLGLDAQKALDLNLEGYSKKSFTNLWQFTKKLAKKSRLKIDENKLEDKYKNVRRTLTVRN